MSPLERFLEVALDRSEIDPGISQSHSARTSHGRAARACEPLYESLNERSERSLEEWSA